MHSLADAFVNVGNVFDADSYWRAGKCPWTIFAFPASVADSQGLPRDEGAKRLFVELQRRGLRVGTWAHPDVGGTIYFACPYEDREHVHAVIKELEDLGEFEPGFCAKRSEHLFSLAAPGT